MKDAYIRNIEYFLPPKKENNLKLLKILGKDKNFSNKIIGKIGIKSRRIANKYMKNFLLKKVAYKIF